MKDVAHDMAYRRLGAEPPSCWDERALAALGCAALAIVVAVLLGACAVVERTRAPRGLQAAAAAAARESGVNLDVLLAVAAAESALTTHGPVPPEGNHGWIRLMPWRATRSPRRAAQLLAANEARIVNEPAQGMRGAAVLLAECAQASDVALAAPVDDWAAALARFHGGPSADANALYAEGVLQWAARGVDAVDDDSLPVALAGHGVPPLPLLRERPGDVVGALDVPYLAAGPAGHRPAAGEDAPRVIRTIVVHTMQSTFPTIVEFFRRPSTEVGAHYLVRSVDGFVLQMIDERRVAFHAACANEDSIGIELEGYVEGGARWYSDDTYRATARLVRDIAERNAVPLDRVHIVGHEEAPGGCSTHTDPGQHFDWPRFMRMLDGHE